MLSDLSASPRGAPPEMLVLFTTGEVHPGLWPLNVLPAQAFVPITPRTPVS